MAISEQGRDFLNNLIDYYMVESGSYRQIAENFIPEVDSVNDATFGIIVGCVYSSFLQTFQNQQAPSLEDMQEFHEIIKKKAGLIKGAIKQPNSAVKAKGSADA